MTVYSFAIYFERSALSRYRELGDDKEIEALVRDGSAKFLDICIYSNMVSAARFKQGMEDALAPRMKEQDAQASAQFTQLFDGLELEYKARITIAFDGKSVVTTSFNG